MFTTTISWRRLGSAFVPLLLMVLLYPFARHIDLFVASFSFHKGADMFVPPAWCSYVYVWGLLPGQSIFVVSSLIMMGGLFYKKLRKSALWASSVYLFLVLSIGSGLIAHGIFKEYFPRPRPKQVVEFNGSYDYLAPLTPFQGQRQSTADKLRSMPSGHATMGFYFLAFWFLGRRFSQPLLSILGLILGFSLGCLLTISRILEGGHFLSDGFVSFLIMWYVALILDAIWRKEPAPKRENIYGTKHI